MRVRVWNAYASNNSGSYTIVGSLPSEEVAQEVAAELTAMIEAHTAWHESDPGEKVASSDSPLATFCRVHELTWSGGDGMGDDWPEHSDDNRPRVVAIGNQVVVHHGYTVSLPPVFGAYFYKRGGRVQNEENHAHHPIVTIATIWWGWAKEQRAQGEAELPRLVEALAAPDELLAQFQAATWPTAWRVDGHGPMLTAGIVFANLIDGVAALSEIARRHGARIYLRLHEAPSDKHDPLSHLRPSSPPPAVPRFDLVVTGAGDNRPRFIALVSEALGLQEWDLRKELLELPCTLARSLSASRAEGAAALLRRAGAVIELVRNDG
jgi:hypothetical protein